MEPIFLTNLNQDEFKNLLKEAVREVMNENYQEPEPDIPRILDVKQTAELLRISVPTLYGKTFRRLVPHFKRGKRLYFILSDLETWIRQGKVKTMDEIEEEANFYLMRNKRR